MASFDIILKVVDQTKAAIAGIESGLESIAKKGQKANDALGKIGNGLKNASNLGAAAFATLTAASLRYADSVVDASDATAISVQTILGYTKAISAAGGSSDGAVASILRFNETINSAASGNKELRKSFAAVGVSLDDLAKLSSEDLLKQVVTGLGGIDDATKRAALSTDLLSKANRGVDYKKVADDLPGLVAAQAKNAQATKDAAAAYDQIIIALGLVGSAFTRLISPVAKFVSTLSPETLDRIAIAVVGLVTALTGLAIISSVVTSFRVLASLGPAIATVFGGLASFTLAIGRGFALALPFIGAFAKGLLRFVPIIGPIIAVGLMLNDIIKSIFNVDIIDNFLGYLGKAYDKFKDFIGLAPDKVVTAAAPASSGAADTPATPPGTTIRDISSAATTASDSFAQLKQDYAALNGAFKNTKDVNYSAFLFEQLSSAAEKLGIVLQKPANLIKRDFTLSVQKANEEVRQLLIQLRDTKAIEGEFVAQLNKTSAELQKQEVFLGQNILVLTKFGNELTAVDQGLRENEQRLANFTGQNTKFELEVKAANQAIQERAQKLANANVQQKIFLNTISELRLGIQEQQVALSNANAALKDNTISTAEYLKIVSNLDPKLLELKDRQVALAESFKQGLVEDSVIKKLAEYELQLAANTGTLKVYADTYSKYKDLLGSSVKGELASTQTAAEKDVKLKQDQTTALQKLIDTYKTTGGVGTAVFREQAAALGGQTDEIDRLATVYGSATERMIEDTKFLNDSISKAATTFSSEFTKAIITGKGAVTSFRDFFGNILNDIATRLIKQNLTDPLADALGDLAKNLFKGASGGGGGSFFGNLLSGLFGGGKAAGGSVNGGTTYMVGEQGPELFVPGRSGAIVPNDALGGGGSSNDTFNVNFSINAVDTQTGIEFLMKNKQVLTSVIEQAYNKRGRRGPVSV